MKKHWFVHFYGTCIYRDNTVYDIEGNSVCTIESDSFLPGAVTRTITELIKSRLEKMVKEIENITLMIDLVHEINLDAAADFAIANPKYEVVVNINFRDVERPNVIGKYNVRP